MAFSCKKENPKAIEQNLNAFFDYNEIDYYHNDIDNSLEGSLEYLKNMGKTKIDTLKFRVLIGEIPESKTDTAFVNKLNEIGYKKINLSEEKQNALKKYFVNKTRKSEPKDALKPMFNDILIFRNNGKIVGFSKMSFEYLQSRVIGSKFNTDHFPTNIEHEEIRKILYE